MSISKMFFVGLGLLLLSMPLSADDQKYTDQREAAIFAQALANPQSLGVVNGYVFSGKPSDIAINDDPEAALRLGTGKLADGLRKLFNLFHGRHFFVATTKVVKDGKPYLIKCPSTITTPEDESDWKYWRDVGVKKGQGGIASFCAVFDSTGKKIYGTESNEVSYFAAFDPVKSDTIPFSQQRHFEGVK